MITESERAAPIDRAQLDDQVPALSSPCIRKSATPRSTIDFGMIFWSTFGRSKETCDLPQVLFKIYV
jgi:hypothetical protein